MTRSGWSGWSRLSRQARVPLVAAGDVYYHATERRALCDVLTATRHGLTVAEAGEHLFPNAQRCLKSPEEMAALFARAPEAVRRTVEVAERVTSRWTSCGTSIRRRSSPGERPEKGTGSTIEGQEEDRSCATAYCEFKLRTQFPEATPIEYLTRLAWTGARSVIPAACRKKSAG